MSQVEGDPSVGADSRNRDPRVEENLPLCHHTDKETEENVLPKQEKVSSEEDTPPAKKTASPKHLGNGTPCTNTAVDLNSFTSTELVTCQDQVPSLSKLESRSEANISLQNGAGHFPDQGKAKHVTENGSQASTVLTPPTSQRGHRVLQSNPSINSHSSKRSKASTRSTSSQIPMEAQEDCCVHCILACLFCEFLTLCNIVLDCTTCGSCTSDESCFCCCCCCSGECGDCDLPCDLDCGIVDACCESADCLEICMECCGLCFSS
ncbi:myoD family inhibitor [Latimeria chalumnae]|nr:PREDICTED: myoD family inhibitor [Latimeria chalumnae]|eukprot:XP_006002343.1 PREDICTED: myoD family inhibitor [Latimeria chalumnae]